MRRLCILLYINRIGYSRPCYVSREPIRKIVRDALIAVIGEPTYLQL